MLAPRVDEINTNSALPDILAQIVGTAQVKKFCIDWPLAGAIMDVEISPSAPHSYSLLVVLLISSSVRVRRAILILGTKERYGASIEWFGPCVPRTE